MAYKYKYTGRGVITVYVDKEQHTLGGKDYPNLPSTVEFPRKVDREGFELISEKKKKIKIESFDSEVSKDDISISR